MTCPVSQPEQDGPAGPDKQRPTLAPLACSHAGDLPTPNVDARSGLDEENVSSSELVHLLQGGTPECVFIVRLSLTSAVVASSGHQALTPPLPAQPPLQRPPPPKVSSARQYSSESNGADYVCSGSKQTYLRRIKAAILASPSQQLTVQEVGTFHRAPILPSAVSYS